MSRNPHAVTKDFEQAIADYTGAPYAVAVNSCTAALMLAVAWHLRTRPWGVTEVLTATGLLAMAWKSSRAVDIPRRTYVSVPMAIIHAGGRPTFRDEDWLGAYQLKPLPVWDSARYFTSGLYRGSVPQVFGDRDDPHTIHSVELTRDCAGQMVCVSFHASKTLGLEQGGAILHDNPDADAWFRRARFDGRTEGVAPKDDTFPMVGWHCYMNPSTAAQGILKLHSLPRHNAPLPNDPYVDLSTLEIFR